MLSISATDFFENGDLVTLADEVKRLRELKGLTQKGLAEAVGLKQPQIANLEAGTSSMALNTMIKFCSFFDLPLNHFVQFIDPTSAVPPPPHQPTFDLPNFGDVPCGPPEIQFTNPPGFTPVSASQYGDDRFVLRAKGDSMTGRNIQSGDLLIFRQSDTADHGDVIVAWTGSGTTVKVYHVRGEGENAEYWLYPASEHGKPVMMTDEYRIIGVLKGVMRDVQSERPTSEPVKKPL